MYGVDGEDSDAINNILGWPESLASERDCTIDIENVERRKINELLEGKEVDDGVQWLTNKGYIVVQKNDVDGISEKTSFHGMVEIYRKLNEKIASNSGREHVGCFGCSHM